MVVMKWRGETLMQQWNKNLKEPVTAECHWFLNLTEQPTLGTQDFRHDKKLFETPSHMAVYQHLHKSGVCGYNYAVFRQVCSEKFDIKSEAGQKWSFFTRRLGLQISQTCITQILLLFVIRKILFSMSHHPSLISAPFCCFNIATFLQTRLLNLFVLKNLSINTRLLHFSVTGWSWSFSHTLKGTVMLFFISYHEKLYQLLKWVFILQMNK